MSATLVDHSLRRGLRPPGEPLRYRAVITIEIEAVDEMDVQSERSAIEDAFAAVRLVQPSAQLDFKRRKPRARPRPGAPGMIIVAYADD
jgi:hypothetical protein